jgi:DnaJ like chaperone protein
VFYWGKIIGVGIGFYLGEIPGTLFGFVLGHLVDKSFLILRQPKFSKINPAELAQVQREFFVATFTVMGHITMASRQVNGDENTALTKVIDRLNLPQEVHQEATTLFNEGKMDDFDLNQVVLPFYTVCRYQTHLLEMFLEIQLFAAFKDGEINPSKKQILLNISRLLDLSRADFDRILSTIRAEYHFKRDKPAGRKSKGKDNNADGAYAILSISPAATNEEIKKAYRRLTSMHHPDKLVAKGLPEEMLKIAEDKTHEIRLAYERIRTLRNF